MTTPEVPHQEARRPRRRRLVTWTLLAGVACLLGWAAQSEFVVVTEEHNGEFAVSSYTLREDDFHNPRLALLRTREKLDEVVSGANTQFAKVVRLRGWAHRQWESGPSFYYPPWDAVEILDLARNEGNRGFCAQYAVVFLQACQSLGIHARYVDLPGHFVTAVWSDDYNRWVLMDPTYDVHYEQGGIPMRGRDLYRAYWTGDLSGIEQVDSEGHRKPVSRDDLGYYRMYSIALSANQLSTPVEVKVNGTSRTLAHADDYHAYPKVGKDELVVMSEFLEWRTRDASESFQQRPQTSDQDDFRYALNQTVILLANERLANRILKIALVSENSPTFNRFVIRSEQSSEWVPTSQPTVKWLLHPGTNQLFARIETDFGWWGSVSYIRVFYKPPLFGFLPSFRGNIFRLQWHRVAP